MRAATCTHRPRIDRPARIGRELQSIARTRVDRDYIEPSREPLTPLSPAAPGRNGGTRFARTSVIFLMQMLCENQNPCYTFSWWPDRTRASRSAGVEAKREKNSFIWIRCNPLKRPK